MMRIMLLAAAAFLLLFTFSWFYSFTSALLELIQVVPRLTQLGAPHVSLL